MEPDIVCKQSAYKHGITIDDILSAKLSDKIA